MFFFEKWLTAIKEQLHTTSVYCNTCEIFMVTENILVCKL